MKISWFHSLRFQLLAGSITGLLILFGLVSLNTSRVLKDFTLQTTRTSIAQISETLNLDMVQHTTAEQLPLLEDYLNGLVQGGENGIVYLAILDEKGRFLARSKTTPEVLPDAGRDLEQQVETGIVHVSHPMLVADNEVGKLRYGLSTRLLLETNATLDRENVLLLASGLTVTVAILIVVGLWVSAQLGRLVQAGEALAVGDYDARVPQLGKGEFSYLANCFNHIAGAVNERTALLQQQRYELEKANEEWRQTFDAVSDCIMLLDPDYRIVKANRAVVEHLGQSADELCGETCYKRVHGENSPIPHCPNKALLIDGQAHSLELFEQKLGGDFIVTASPLYDSGDKLIGSVLVGHDISDRKRAEEERLVLMERQKDELVREVHHRIKNHLQGLVNLLGLHRESGRVFAESMDDVITQIGSIAIIYGIQAKGSGKQICLNQMLHEILLSVSGITPLSFSTEIGVEKNTFFVAGDQAVALALVVNELLMNAVKHVKSGDKKAEIKVSLQAETENSGVLLTLSNPGRLPDGFDFQAGRGLGTGLDLMRVMLPRNAAQLSISEDGTEVTAALELRAPLIVFMR